MYDKLLPRLQTYLHPFVFVCLCVIVALTYHVKFHFMTETIAGVVESLWCVSSLGDSLKFEFWEAADLKHKLGFMLCLQCETAEKR